MFRSPKHSLYDLICSRFESRRREGFKTSDEWQYNMTQKSTEEIRKILGDAKLDFESIENKALNDYLPKIFHTCPFTEDLCTTRQCTECSVFVKQKRKK